MKLLIWFVLGIVVVLWLMHDRKSLTQAGNTQARQDDRPGADSEAMCRCAHCGIHFPASEALPAPSGAVFCCEEHRRRHVAS